MLDLAVVRLRDAALSVSATHGQQRLHAGRSVGHIVDPVSGEPVRRARIAAVVARHGAVAEVWSTALLVQVERALDRGQPLAELLTALPARLAVLVAVERLFQGEPGGLAGVGSGCHDEAPVRSTLGH